MTRYYHSFKYEAMKGKFLPLYEHSLNPFRTSEREKNAFIVFKSEVSLSDAKTLNFLANVNKARVGFGESKFNGLKIN